VQVSTAKGAGKLQGSHSKSGLLLTPRSGSASKAGGAMKGTPVSGGSFGKKKHQQQRGE
jgi:hypothetical protein